MAALAFIIIFLILESNTCHDSTATTFEPEIIRVEHGTLISDALDLIDPRKGNEWEILIESGIYSEKQLRIFDTNLWIVYDEIFMIMIKPLNISEEELMLIVNSYCKLVHLHFLHFDEQSRFALIRVTEDSILEINHCIMSTNDSQELIYHESPYFILETNTTFICSDSIIDPTQFVNCGAISSSGSLLRFDILNSRLLGINRYKGYGSSIDIQMKQNSQAKIDNCIFSSFAFNTNTNTQYQQQKQQYQQQLNESIEWQSSVNIIDGYLIIVNSQFIGCVGGGLSIYNSNIIIDSNTIFNDNFGLRDQYSSERMNIICQGEKSAIQASSQSFFDQQVEEQSQKSHWIVLDINCKINEELDKVSSIMVVPIILNCSSEESQNKTYIQFEIDGTKFISYYNQQQQQQQYPLIEQISNKSIGLYGFQLHPQKNNHSQEILTGSFINQSNITSQTQYEYPHINPENIYWLNDTTIYFDLPISTFSNYSSGLWDIRLLYGQSGETCWFTIFNNTYSTITDVKRERIIIIISIIFISLGIALLICIILFLVLIWLRRKDKYNQYRLLRLINNNNNNRKDISKEEIEENQFLLDNGNNESISIKQIKNKQYKGNKSSNNREIIIQQTRPYQKENNQKDSDKHKNKDKQKKRKDKYEDINNQLSIKSDDQELQEQQEQIIIKSILKVEDKNLDQINNKQEKSQSEASSSIESNKQCDNNMSNENCEEIIIEKSFDQKNSNQLNQQEDIIEEEKEDESEQEQQLKQDQEQQEQELDEQFANQNNFSTLLRKPSNKEQYEVAYGLSTQAPFDRIKVNGLDTLFNRMHFHKKGINNPLVIISDIIVGLKYLLLIEEERQYNQIKNESIQSSQSQLQPQSQLIENEDNSNDGIQRTKSRRLTMNDSLSNVQHPFMGEFTSYRIMFDENNKAVIFLGNISGFESNKYIWEEIDGRKKENNMNTGNKQEMNKIKSNFSINPFQSNTLTQKLLSDSQNDQQQQEQEQEQYDNMTLRFRGYNHDGNSSLGGGYESIRWRPPEYQGLSSNWDEYMMNKQQQNNNQQINSNEQENEQGLNQKSISYNSQSHLNVESTNESSVVFSLGVIIWEMLTGEIPFGEVDAISASNRIMNGQRPSLSGYEDTRLGNLIEQCWCQYPSQRISLDELYMEIQELIKMNSIEQQSSQQKIEQQNESGLTLIQQLSKEMSPRQYRKYINMNEKQKSDLQTHKRKKKENEAFRKLKTIFAFKNIGFLKKELNQEKNQNSIGSDQQQQDEQEQEQKYDQIIENNEDEQDLSDGMGSLKRRRDEDYDEEDV